MIFVIFLFFTVRCHNVQALGWYPAAKTAFGLDPVGRDITNYLKLRNLEIGEHSESIF